MFTGGLVEGLAEAVCSCICDLGLVKFGIGEYELFAELGDASLSKSELAALFAGKGLSADGVPANSALNPGIDRPRLLAEAGSAVNAAHNLLSCFPLSTICLSVITLESPLSLRSLFSSGD